MPTCRLRCGGIYQTWKSHAAVKQDKHHQKGQRRDHHAGRKDQQHKDHHAIAGKRFAKSGARLGKDFEKPDILWAGQAVAFNKTPLNSGVERIGIRQGPQQQRACRDQQRDNGRAAEDHQPCSAATCVSNEGRIVRPTDLDAMARINGVGSKKLDKFGAEFLSVIAGPVREPHPARRKLAGREAGALYDQLLAAQADLARGPEGTDKPLSCSASQLAKGAELQPDDPHTLERLLGDRRAERFGAAFLDVLRQAG